MAAVSSFSLMSTQQQEVEKTWYNAMIQLASAANGTTEIVLPAQLKGQLGSDGIMAIAQRCSSFSNAHVEVKDDEITDSVRINVLSPGSLSQSEKTADSTPEATPSPKKAKVSRPANAFILYRQHHHPTIVAQNPGVHNNEISKIIGKMWRDESTATRALWKEKSDAVKVQHQREHPDYQYQPRKPHEKKRRMTKRKAELLASSSGASSSSNTTTVTAAAATNTAADIQGPYRTVTMLFANNVPSFDYYAGGNQAVFTYDAQNNDHQLDLLDFMIDAHNGDPAHGLRAPLAATNAHVVPAASTALPTAINTATPTPALTQAQFGLAQTHLSGFELSLEDALALELENMDHHQQQEYQQDRHHQQDFVPQQYNDLESQRFTEFLEQMPDHMWGMEFVN